MVDRWACGQMLCRAHPASREPGLPSLPILACKVLPSAVAQASWGAETTLQTAFGCVSIEGTS